MRLRSAIADLRRKPGIHTPDRGYGFRARSSHSRPGNDENHDPTHRHADRTDGNPDVVAAGGGDGEDPRFSTGGDDVRDRRFGRTPDMDRAAGSRPSIAATAHGVDRRGRRA